MSRQFPLPARGLVLVFALALAALGFGHRFASASEIARAQFAQLYGSEFCQTGDEGAPVHDGSCPVCHMVASVYLPDAVLGAETPVAVEIAAVFVAEEHIVTGTTPRISPPPRGPPLA